MGSHAPTVHHRAPVARPLHRGTLSQNSPAAPGTTGLAQAVPPPSQAVLGQRVLNFARNRIGHKVGDGECFALADQALRAAGAATAENFGQVRPNTNYVWSSQTVTAGAARPGDIVQLRNFSIRQDVARPDGSSSWQTESRPHHTGIVVSSRTEGGIVFLTILEQNVDIGGTPQQPKKSVRQNEIPTSSGRFHRGQNSIAYKVSGHLWIYRPVARTP